jgi:hypothetical protein
MRKNPVSFQMLISTRPHRAALLLVSQLTSRPSVSLSSPSGCSTARHTTDTATQLIATGRKYNSRTAPRPGSLVLSRCANTSASSSAGT